MFTTLGVGAGTEQREKLGGRDVKYKAEMRKAAVLFALDGRLCSHVFPMRP